MTNPIGWCNRTWSPVTGCSPVSDGCKNCWAESMHKRLEAMKQSGYKDGAPHFSVRLHTDRLRKPLGWKKPQRIFVCSMGDLFHKDVPDAWIDSVMGIAALCPQHTFLILTKRPLRMKEYFDKTADRLYGFPFRHLWLGVSVENQKTADERIPLLLQTPAAKRFVSYEPALAPVDFSKYFSRSVPPDHENGTGYMTTGLSWIIMGAEQSHGARYMNPQWARDALAHCRAAGVPFFMKKMSKGEFTPADLMVKGIPR